MSYSVHFFVFLHLVATTASFSDKDIVRRFIHGCPFAFPCPPPPCFNAVYGPGNCCGSCPEPTTPTPEITTTLTGPIDASQLEKRVPVENNSRRNVRLSAFERYVTKMTPSTTTDCPNPCTHMGQRYCHPLPCHIACVNAVRPKGGCCYVCPDGPNCGYNGHVIAEGQNLTLPSGEYVFCHSGGIYGGSFSVVKPIVG